MVGHPFTRRTITITVTAMSGVAATLSNGETDITDDEIYDLQDCRLFIVDEISFAIVRYRSVLLAAS